jgi:hypothetical protein
MKPPQRREITGPAVYQVANAPDHILIRIKLDHFQQALELVKTPLNIAHHVGRHVESCWFTSGLPRV